jgi:glucan phosphoethanolaminetransferase (alkaline phosphatase superfamily)
MLFTANFFPICFLVYQKNLWEDNDVKLLFTSVAAEIAVPNYNPADDEQKLKAMIDTNLKQSNQYFKLYSSIAILIYIATLVVYGVVVSVREETKIKCLGIVTPIFILFCDLVILSLREKPATIDGQTESKEMQITDVIYSSAF